MSKGFKTYLSVWAILFALFNIIAWVVPVDHDQLFFTGYGFTVGAMLIQLLISYFALKASVKEVKYTSVIFSVFGMLLIAVINILSIILKTKSWILVVINSIVLALNYITVISAKSVYEKRAEADRRISKG